MEKPAPSPNNKALILLVCALFSFSMPFVGVAIIVALPSISRDLNLNAIILGWIPMAYLLASAVFLVPIGRIADIYGHRKIFLSGAVLYTLSYCLMPLSQSGTMLIILSALEGIGTSAAYSTSLAILNSTFPPGERGKALGISTAAVYAGLSSGPLIGGFMTSHFTWRSIFFINILLGIVVLLIILLKIKGQPPTGGSARIDYPGSIIYCLGLSLLILGFSQMPAPAGGWLLASGFAGLGFFVWWELKTPNPVLNLDIFRNNSLFAWSSVAALINYCATNAIALLLSLYLQYIKGFSTEQAGLILISQYVIQMAISPVSGRLSDRWQPRIVSSIGMGLTTIGLVLMALIDQNSSLWSIILPLVVLGMGFGLFVAPNTNAAFSAVSKSFLGVASGVIGTMRALGQLLSLATVVMLFAIIIGHVQITEPYYPLFLKSMHIAFIIFAVLCAGGVLASLARGKMQR